MTPATAASTASTKSIGDLVPVHPRAHFNLGVEQWIPVVTERGVERVGLVDALLRAHEIHDLAIVDPLEKYALTRYLLSLTYLVHAYEPGGDWSGVVKADGGEWGALPRSGVEAVIERLSECWWLFHPKAPFMQLPELLTSMGKKVTDKDTLVSVTEGYECLVPFRPAKSNEAWWYRTDGSPLDMASAPLALLSRHFGAISGNEAGVCGQDKTRCEGGVMVAGPQEVTSLLLQGPRLSVTLAANLVEAITQVITPESVLFFEAPTQVAAHLDDALYRYTASGGAAYLVWNGDDDGVWRVLRAPLPVSASTAKQLMVAARLMDPHVLRARQPSGSLDSNNPNKGIVAFSAAASQFENVFELYRRSSTGMSGLRTNIVNPADLTLSVKPSTLRLSGVTIDGGGTFTGMRIESTVAISMDLMPLTLDPSRALTLRLLLGRLADGTSSCLSQLSYELGQALGGGGSLGAPKVKGLRREASIALWAAADGAIQDLYETVASAPLDTLPSSLGESIKKSWIDATVEVFDTLTATYVNSPRTRARVYEHRLTLRRALWNKL